MPKSILSLSAIALALFLTTANAVEADQLKSQGQKLRTEIDETYKNLKAKNALKTSPQGSDISAILLKYISVGSTFDNAEAILKAAGFKIDARPGPHPPGNRPDKNDVGARIDPYETAFMQKVSVWVSLAPKTPGDYSSIAKISGAIFVDMP